MNILVSAGESSGDLYTAELVKRLRRRLPGAGFFGCAGPRMQEAGVRTVVDASSLAVVGLAEVVSHLPRIYGEYRKLLSAAEAARPAVAILTDSPDFHLRLARRLRAAGIPVIYLVAPQVWAWRRGRIRTIRRTVVRLLCIFPFEEKYFLDRGVAATYIGHPLATLARPELAREEFLHRYRMPAGRPLIALLPGSRRGEVARHLPALIDAAVRIHDARAATFVLAAPGGGFLGRQADALTSFTERIQRTPIQVIEGQTWDVLAHADLALAASGTVTIEAALLGAPMVTFYRVNRLSWRLGKFLVDVPFYSMVNLVAGKKVVPELMQNEMRGERLAAEALRLLNDSGACREMRQDLEIVAARLASSEDPLERAAALVEEFLSREERSENSNGS